MPSTAPIATASEADDETASSTVETAQSTSRPRASAIDRMLAIASLRTLSPIVPSSSSPPEPTGDAAPMLVPGRHVGEVRGERDERARAGRPPAARRDPHDRRQGSLEQAGDDPLRGVEAAARRVDGDDQRGRGVLGGSVDRLPRCSRPSRCRRRRSARARRPARSGRRPVPGMGSGPPPGSTTVRRGQPP